MENITVENANEMMAKAKISDTTHTKQAAAWVIVNQFCYQAGLYNNREDDHLSGIQKVIKYLSETQSEIKALREENTRLTTKFIEEEHTADHPNEKPIVLAVSAIHTRRNNQIKGRDRETEG